MTTKEYLNQAYNIQKEIELLELKIERLTAMAEKCTSTISDMPRPASPSNDSREKLICRIVDCRNEMYSKIDEHMSALEEIGETIDNVEDCEERYLLELRYVYHCSWEDISEKMGRSLRSIYRIHGKALLSAQEILKVGSIWQ